MNRADEARPASAMPTGSVQSSPAPAIISVPFRTLIPSTWVWVLASLILAMIGTKSVQCYIEVSPAKVTFFGVFHAFFLGIKRRTDDISFFVLFAASAAMYCYSFAAALYLGNQEKRRKLEVGGFSLACWVALTLTGWSLYLLSVATAPDPGTFFTNLTGTVKFVQVVEGITNLVAFALAFAWIVIIMIILHGMRAAETASRSADGVRRDRFAAAFVIIAAALPIPLFLIMSVVLSKKALINGWEQGNDYYGALGFALFLLLSFSIPALKALGTPGLKLAAILVPLFQIIVRPVNSTFIYGDVKVDQSKNQTFFGPVTNSNVGIDTYFENVRTNIGAMTSNDLKDHFDTLSADVAKAIAALQQSGKENEAKKAAKCLARLSEDAIESKPDAGALAVSRAGLLEAVKTVSEMAGPIAATISTIFSVLHL